MSIATRRGDDGSTALMYGRRVLKSHPRVEAIGFVDELNAALGQVRCQAAGSRTESEIRSIQDRLVDLMGELSTDRADRERYLQGGFRAVDKEFVKELDSLVAVLESRMPPLKGWAKPGDNPASAGLDAARCVCRRAERQVCRLLESGMEPNQEIQRYLNRLSDVLWLMARRIEIDGAGSGAAKR